MLGYLIPLRSLPLVLVIGVAGNVQAATLAYVANAANNNVQIIDLDTGATVNKLYTGAAPWRLIESPDGKRLIVQHWYSETTAVVNTATNDIEAVLPVRGPGLFSPAGDKFWSYSWPGGFLQAYDAKSFKAVAQRQTETRAVYAMQFWGKDRLYLGQYDPVSKFDRQVFDQLLALRLEDLGRFPSTIRVGTSAARLALDPTGNFLFTANVDSRTLTIVNKNGATAQIALRQSPRDVLFTPDGKRLFVLCWTPGLAQSEVLALDVDLTARPWPAVKEGARTQIVGGLIAARLTSDGRRLYAIDRPNKRLVRIDVDGLMEGTSIPLGDEPMALVLREVSAAERVRLAQKPAARKRLELLIEGMKRKGAPFRDVTFTETQTLAVADAAAGNEPDPNATQVRGTTSVSQVAIKLPDSMRQELADGGVRLAQGGYAIAINKDGRYHDTPRQDLLHLLYTVFSLPTADAARHLAGDIPGSPFLRNGLAVDIVRSVTEQRHRYYVIGAMTSQTEVSQLWLSEETGLPVTLVEQFPVMRARNPHAKDPGFQGLSETKIIYQKVNGHAVPFKLQRYLDGKEVGRVVVSDVRFNRDLPEERFDLARLGGVLRAFRQSAATLQTAANDAGPGVAFASEGNLHIAMPFESHTPYATNPPTSGPHTPYIADWGVHRIPIPPETQVHSLEDGAVLVQYSCPTACPELVSQLEAFARRYDHVVVAPYPLMQDRIALTAWQRRETLDEFDERRVVAFIEAYAGQDHHPKLGERSR